MSTQVIKGRPVWIDGYEFSNQLNSAALDHGADDLDATTLDDTTRVHKPGLKSSGFAIEGFFNAADVDSEMFGNIALEDVPVCIAAMNGAAGEIGYFFKTVQGEYTHGGSVGELHTFSAGGNARGDLIRGSIHINGAAIAASAASAGIQMGAVSAGQKLYAALFVTSASGTLDVVVESDDNSGFTSAASRITFAQATAKGAQYIELDGPLTDDYFRVDYTVTGTFSFMVVIGIQ